ADLWLRAANRINLMEKSIESLHKYFKLCELHFESKFMSCGNDRKTLFLNAFPTIFPHIKRHADNQISPHEHSEQVLIDASTSEVTQKFVLTDAEPAMIVEPDIKSSSQNVPMQLQSIS
uniref:52 kDa repressor of the inhibitor of the protein kinase-like n=1 Tax=Diabrotica virgifera virgifera TaxID=50390 RepID=A0A6P7GZV1_DIAVI